MRGIWMQTEIDLQRFGAQCRTDCQRQGTDLEMDVFAHEFKSGLEYAIKNTYLVFSNQYALNYSEKRPGFFAAPKFKIGKGIIDRIE